MLNDKRRGEIALLILKERVFKEGANVSCKTKRGIHSGAKALGIDPDELMEFAEEIFRETIDRVFPKK